MKLTRCECFLVMGVPVAGNPKKISQLEVLSLKGEKFEVAGNTFYIHKAVYGKTKKNKEVDYSISNEDYIITEANTGMRVCECHGGELHKEQQLDKFVKMAKQKATNIACASLSSNVESNVKLMTAAKNGELAYIKLR